MSRFELDQALEQPVILGITDQRIIEHMVLIVVLLKLLSQRDNLVFGRNFKILCHKIS
jgi:hypothetical protein